MVLYVNVSAEFDFTSMRKGVVESSDPIVFPLAAIECDAIHAAHRQLYIYICNNI